MILSVLYFMFIVLFAFSFIKGVREEIDEGMLYAAKKWYLISFSMYAAVMICLFLSASYRGE